MTRLTAQQLGGQNVAAFMDMIAVSELGTWLLQHSDDGYNILVGATPPTVRNGQSVPANLLTFEGYTDHPDILNHALNSTAAGRYQILYKFWPHYKAQLNLPDFSPESQDWYCLQQLRERKALPMLQAGRFADAVQACNNIWASLTGSPYGQHTHPIEYLASAYQAAGGRTA